MKFGVTIPNNWGIFDPQEVLAFGPLAEELGYDSVWVMDHLFNTGYIQERLQDKPYYHPLGTLSYLAATTKRVLLGTSHGRQASRKVYVDHVDRLVHHDQILRQVLDRDGNI